MCAAITTAAIGVASAGYSIYSGEKQKSDAKKAMENLEVPELENPYEDMRISTMGSDLLREEGQRRTATIIDGLRGGGARNMMSAIPSLVAMNNDINQKAKVDIDKQMLDRERMIAGYGEKQNQYEENRYQGALAGLGELYNAGDHKMWNGIRTGISSVGALGRSIGTFPSTAKALEPTVKQATVAPVPKIDLLSGEQIQIPPAYSDRFNSDNYLGYLSSVEKYKF